MPKRLLARAIRESERRVRQVWVTLDCRGCYHLRLAFRAGESLVARVIGSEVFYD